MNTAYLFLLPLVSAKPSSHALHVLAAKPSGELEGREDTDEPMVDVEALEEYIRWYSPDMSTDLILLDRLQNMSN